VGPRREDVLLKGVVIGYSLESALFALLNGHYHIQSYGLCPLFFEECEDFSLFGTKNRKQIWQRIKLYLGFLSKGLDYPDLKQIRIQDNTIKIFDDNMLATYEFEKCYVFETLNVSHENDVKVPKQETYKVIDDFTIARLGRSVTNIDPISTGDDLLSKAYFYNSLRVDGAKHVTDAITVSYLTKKQLYEFDYSDTMVGFKLKSCLNSIGYIGLKDKETYKSGKPIYRKLIINHIKRHVIPLDNNEYISDNKVEFVNLSILDIINGTSTKR
jgi:hypothetical protein